MPAHNLRPDTVRELTDRRESSIEPTRQEAERVILAQLENFYGRAAKRWYPDCADGLCPACGLRPKFPMLCVGCEARRTRLHARYPDGGR